MHYKMIILAASLIPSFYQAQAQTTVQEKIEKIKQLIREEEEEQKRVIDSPRGYLWVFTARGWSLMFQAAHIQNVIDDLYKKLAIYENQLRDERDKEINQQLKEIACETN